MSNAIRAAVCRMPHGPRYVISQIFAILLYWPLARTAFLLEKLGMNVESFPLSQYRHNSFYVMRNDALDRFGTRLEQRFSKSEITAMMERCGLKNITFSTTSFWTAVGFKAEPHA